MKGQQKSYARYLWRPFGYKTGKNGYPGKLGKLSLLPWTFAVSGTIGWKVSNLAGDEYARPLYESGGMYGATV